MDFRGENVVAGVEPLGGDVDWPYVGVLVAARVGEIRDGIISDAEAADFVAVEIEDSAIIDGVAQLQDGAGNFARAIEVRAEVERLHVNPSIVEPGDGRANGLDGGCWFVGDQGITARPQRIVED